MGRLRALNESSSSSEDSSDEGENSDVLPNAGVGSGTSRKLTKEAEEALVQEKYKNAMLKLASDQKEEAKIMFEEILTSKVLREVEGARGETGNILNPIYYAICKNLAIMVSDEGDHGRAVKLFLKALTVDDTEALLWYKLGIQAFKANDYWLSRYGFEKCLNINPTFWPCLDNLISLLYIIGDYSSCLICIKKALNKQADYLRGLVIKDEIFRQNPYLKEITESDFIMFSGNLYDHDRAKEILDKLNFYVKSYLDQSRPSDLKVLTPEFEIIDPSITSIGQAISKLYRHLRNTTKIVNPLNLNKWIENVKNSLSCPRKQSNNCDNVDVHENVEAVCKDVMDTAIQAISEPAAIAVDTVSESDTDEIQLIEQPVETEIQLSSTSATPELDIPNSGTSSPSSTSERQGRRRWKRKHVFQGGPSMFKRRSTRLIPGFCMDDPEAFGPLTTKPVTLVEHLRSYMPAVFGRGSERDTDAQETVQRPRSTSLSEEKAVDLLDDVLTASDMALFIEENNGNCILDLLWSYIDFFRKRGECNFAWSDQLRSVFMECFEFWKNHAQFLVPSNNESNQQCKEEGLARLLYVECKILKGQCSQIDDPALVSLLSHLSHLATSRMLFNEDDEEWSKFRCRVDWVNAVVQERKKNYGGANWNLISCHYVLKNCRNGRTIYLKHCGTTISLDLLQHHMERLEHAALLDSIEEIYGRGDWQTVIDTLAPIFLNSVDDQDGRSERYKQYEILLICYHRLQKPQEAIPVFIRALKFALTLYGGLNIDEKRSWWKTMANLLSIGEWLFRRTTIMAAIEKLTPVQVYSLSHSLIEVISLEQSWPLDNNDIPEVCWLSPWLILYEINRHIEIKNFDEAYATSWYENASSSTVVLATRSLMILWKGHEELGRKKLCMLRNGSVLIFFAEEILNALRDPIVTKCLQSSCADDMLNAAEQCFYCLFKYPQKKKRHLEEHEATPIELNWNAAHLVFEFVKPDKAPEFDDHVHATGVSADSAHMLHRIESIVPRMLRPDPFEKQLGDFFKNPAPDTFPEMGESEPVISDLYHLLADYYLKTKEIEKAVRYYQLDLCVSADRCDSWAGLAMARGHLLNTRLNSMDLTYSAGSWEWINCEARAALYCFEEATRLRENHYVLLVEYASLSYALHSFFSRSIKHVGYAMTEGDLASLNTARDGYLTKAQCALTKAQFAATLSTNDQNDIWIHFYLLGKVLEKRKSEDWNDFTLILKYYLMAIYRLNEDGAQFPDKIKYNAPQRYSLEALEMYYRGHACAIKWLLRGTLTNRVLYDVCVLLNAFRGGPFCNRGARSTSQSDITMEHDLADKANTDDCNNHTTDDFKELDEGELKRKLVQMCSDAFQLCLRRFSNHYKSHYWLAMIYFSFEEYKDFHKCRQLLLGPVDITEFQVQFALFQHRKSTNYFESIWRIPSDDVDRSGSFAEHIFRSVNLLCKVLENLRDHESLTELVIALQRKPAIDKHKYLREPDRQELLEQASQATERVYESLFDIEQTDALLALYRFYLALYKMQTPNKNRWHDLIRRMVSRRRMIPDVDLQTALVECARLERMRIAAIEARRNELMAQQAPITVSSTNAFSNQFNLNFSFSTNLNEIFLE